MDWAAAARRHDESSLEGRVFGAISRLARARRSLLALRAGGSTDVLPAGHPSVLAYRRAHPRSAPFLSLTNFSDVTQSADAGILARAGLHQPVLVHSSTVPSGAGRLELAGGRIELPPWGFAWLSGT
jgi:amylosucrase